MEWNVFVAARYSIWMCQGAQSEYQQNTHVQHAPSDAFLAALANVSVRPGGPAEQPPVAHDRIHPSLDLAVGFVGFGEQRLFDQEGFVDRLDALQLGSLP